VNFKLLPLSFFHLPGFSFSLYCGTAIFLEIISRCFFLKGSFRKELNSFVPCFFLTSSFFFFASFFYFPNGHLFLIELLLATSVQLSLRFFEEESFLIAVSTSRKVGWFGAFRSFCAGFFFHLMSSALLFVLCKTSAQHRNPIEPFEVRAFFIPPFSRLNTPPAL